MSEWTVDTLRDDVLARMAAHREFDDERHRLGDIALSKSETAYDRRFQSVNEFREQLADQQATFMRRAEYTIAHQALLDRVAKFETAQVEALGHRLGARDSVGYIVGIVGILSALIASAGWIVSVH